MNKKFILLLVSIFFVNYTQAQIAYIPSGTNPLENSSIKVVDLVSNTVINTIEIGKEPSAMTINSDESKIYITNGPDGTVNVIDTESNTISETINIGAVISGIALSPDENFLYVLLIDDGVLKIVDLNTLSVSDPIGTGPIPASIAASPNGEKVFFSNHYGESVGVLETATNSVDIVPLNRLGPNDILVSPDNSKAYLTTVAGYLITIDAATNAVIHEFTTATPNSSQSTVYTDLTQHPDGSKLYFMDWHLEELYVYDTELFDIIETIPIGGTIVGIDISPDEKKLILLAHSSNTVKVVDLETYEVESTNISSLEAAPISGRFIINSTSSVSTKNLEYHSGIFSVAPNPVSQSINFSINDVPSPALNYKLINSLGQLSKSGIINSSEAQLSIETSSLSNGTYILSISGEDWISSEKVTLLKN